MESSLTAKLEALSVKKVESKKRNFKFFREIPKTMQMEILRKLHNQALCRMRRTCSYLENVVEQNKDVLSKRLMRGPNLWIEEGSLMLARLLPMGAIQFFLHRSFERSFSAISLFEIFVNFDDSDESFESVKDMLERLKPSCVTCIFTGTITARRVVECANLIYCKRMIDFRNHVFDPDDFKVLAEADNRHKMKIRLQTPILNDFDYLKLFGSVQQDEGDARGKLEQLIWHLYQTGDIGNLEKICYPELVWGKLSLPETTLMWDCDNAPETYLSGFSGPNTIEYLKLPIETHCAFLSINRLINNYCEYTITFVENNPSAFLRQIVAELDRKKIPQEYYDKFAQIEAKEWPAFCNNLFVETHHLRFYNLRTGVRSIQ